MSSLLQSEQPDPAEDDCKHDARNWDVPFSRTYQAWEPLLIYLHREFNGLPVRAREATKSILVYAGSNPLPHELYPALYSKKDRRSPPVRVGQVLRGIQGQRFNQDGLRVDKHPSTYRTGPNWWVFRDNGTYGRKPEG